MKHKKSRELIDLFEEIRAFMEGNLDKWNSIEEIRRTYDEFTHNLKKVKDLQPDLEQDLSPVKKELESKRNLLIQKLFPIISILEVYVEDHKMSKKFRSILVNNKNPESLKNRDLMSFALKVYKNTDKQMNKLEGSLKDKGQVSPGKEIQRYGLTQAMMDELYAATHQFESAMNLRKDITIYREKTQKRRDSLIKENRKLIKRRLNKLMTIFSGTHPTFYQEYKGIVSRKKASLL